MTDNPSEDTVTYPTDTPTAADPTAALIADGRPFIRCPCGFIAISSNPDANREALEEHDCPQVPVEPPRPPRARYWYDFLSTFWGFAIVLTVAWAVLAALGVTKW